MIIRTLVPLLLINGQGHFEPESYNNIDLFPLVNEFGTTSFLPQDKDEETNRKIQPLCQRKPSIQVTQNKPFTDEEQRNWFRNQIKKRSNHQGSETVKKVTSNLAVAVSLDAAVGNNSKPLTLTLNETETVWLLTIISGYHDSEEIGPSDEGKTEKNNKSADIGEAPRKSLNAEAQTPKNSEKSKGSETTDIKATHSFVNASAWDLYDTYAQVGGEGLGIKEFQLLIDTALKTRGVIQAQPGSSSEFTRLPAEKQMKRLVKNDRFQYCVLAIERLLASKTFEKKQNLLNRRPKGKYDTVPPSLFSYKINLLWTYDNHFKQPLTVTAFDWNPENSLLLAVGYGRLNFQDEGIGCVCLWSPKNPSHPERKFLLGYAVTSLCFSTIRPNILAVGCRTGEVLLIDVSHTEGTIKLLPRGELPPRFGPIWKVEWFSQHSTVGVHEQLMVLGDTGVLTCFSLNDQNSSSDILQLSYTILIGSQQQSGKDQSTNNSKAVFCTKTLSGLWFSLVPEQHLCYISSKEGIIAKCTIRSPCSTDVRMSAHMGPVYVIQHSSATPRIFLTCGADHYLKIWVDGISEPLLSLISDVHETMVFAQWSPTLPTVIACITSSELSIWDIARKFSEPVNSIRLRSVDQAYSNIRFAPDGSGLVVGDHQGHVKVYQLSELPRPPYLPVEALVSALEAALYRKSALLHKFKKLLHFNKEEFKTHFV